MKQIKFLAAAFMLLFAVSAGAQTNTTDEGVVINGVKWATRNIDESGTFASTPASAGKLFQWNRTKAWDNTASGPVVGWNSTASTSTEWTSANDPSPTGWRVPVYEEIKSLLDTTKVSSEWAWQPGGMGSDVCVNESWQAPCQAQ